MAKPEDIPTLHDGDSDDGSDDEVGKLHIASKKRASPTPSRSSERKKRAGPAITLGATLALLREAANQAARDDATMQAASSLEAGGEPARPPFALPRCVREVLGAEARDANFKKNAEAVKKLRELLQKHNYNLPPEEDAALDRRDADGNVSCTLIVNGFPVNGNHPWLDGSGGGLARSVQHVVNVPHLGATLAAWPPGTTALGLGCSTHGVVATPATQTPVPLSARVADMFPLLWPSRSMGPHAVQLASCGLLSNFCRIDIHPPSAHYNDCHTLPRALMNETAKCA